MMTGAGNKTEDLRETHGSQQEGPNGDRETTKRQTGGVANSSETSGCRWKMWMLEYPLKPPTTTCRLSSRR
jgi:hypothetical protein